MKDFDGIKMHGATMKIVFKFTLKSYNFLFLLLLPTKIRYDFSPVA